MSRPILGTRDPGGRGEYPWDVPFRRAVHHLRLGTWDVRVLDQARVWVDSAGTVHRIEDLSDEHLANVVDTLRRRAVEIMVDYCAAAGLGRFTPKAPLPPMTGTVQDVARDWIMKTRVWDALQREYRARAARRPGTVRSLGSDTGVWAVRTENSTHVLDLDHSQMVRLAQAAAGELRGDQQWMTLDAHGPIRVGRPSWFQVKVSDDPHVAITIRKTSPVVAIHHLTPPAGATPADLVDLARAATSVRRPDHPALEPLTEYRTARFRATAGEVRTYWAALDVLLRRHHATGALIVPTRLRHPGADTADGDLFIGQSPTGDVHPLQLDVDDALGYHLPVTTIADYPARTRADVTAHAIALTPGW